MNKAAPFLLAFALVGSGLTPLVAQATGPASYTAILLVSGKSVADADHGYTSNAPDSSGIAALAGAAINLKNVSVVVTGSSTNQESSNLWGTDAGVLAAAGGKVIFVGGSIQTLGVGANAVFSTGKGTKVVISGTTLSTSRDFSRGLVATSSGAIEASSLVISTAGAHSPAIATDRGEAVVTGGTMKTSGEGSPALSSLGNISLTGAILVASGSEAAVVEGKSSITLVDTTLVGAKKQGVMLYQSVSGDSSAGGSVFTMSGGSLTALEGPLFFAANTRAEVNLKQATLVQNSGLLVKITGASLTVNADNQTLAGDLVVEATSTVALNLKSGSAWTGAADTARTAKSVDVSLDAASTWTVTADSRVNTLALAGADASAASVSKYLTTNGHAVAYKSSANPWLGGKRLTLDDGGILTPY